MNLISRNNLKITTLFYTMNVNNNQFHEWASKDMVKIDIYPVNYTKIVLGRGAVRFSLFFFSAIKHAVPRARSRKT